MRNFKLFIHVFAMITLLFWNNSISAQSQSGIYLDKFDIDKHFAKLSDSMNIQFEIKNYNSREVKVILKTYLSRSPASYAMLDIVNEDEITIEANGSYKGAKNMVLPADIIAGKWFVSFRIGTDETIEKGNEPANETYMKFLVYEVTLYGSWTCGYTRGLMDELGFYGIPYYFKDVIKNNDHNNEMWEKLKSIDYTKTNADFPVVDVNGEIMIRPKVNKVMKSLKQ